MVSAPEKDSQSEAATRQPGTWGEPPGMRDRSYLISSPSRGRRDLRGPPHHHLLREQTEQPHGKQSGAMCPFLQGCQRTKGWQMTCTANSIKSLSDWLYHMHRQKRNWAISFNQKKASAPGFVLVLFGSGQRSRDGRENDYDNRSFSDSEWSLFPYLPFCWSLIWGPWGRT